MVMIDDYIEYTNIHKKTYGERTVVLIEVGSFFEIYAVINDEVSEGATDIYYIADICNFQVSRKNKTILEISRKNHLMAGFPSYALSKHSQTLLNNNYTIALYEQVTPPPNPERKLTQILSPSMQVSVHTVDGNYLMVTVWDVYKDSLGTRFFSLGIAGVDVSTGRTWVYEVMRGTGSALDEFTRCFQLYQPSEIVCIGNNLTDDERRKIEDTIGVRMDTARSYHLLWDLNISMYEKVSYQNEILLKAYSWSIANFGILKGLEALSIDKYENARIAFVYMIQFGYEHSETIIKSLMIPDHIQFEGQCTLEYNSALQLQLISTNNTEKPLLSILNRCATAFASRRFREQLLQPINNVSTLKIRYEKIQNMVDSGNYNRVHSILKGIQDIERMLRRMIVGRFQPSEWSSFHNSMEAALASMEAAAKDKDKDSYNDNINIISDVKKIYVDTLNLEEASKYNIGDIKRNIFQTGIYKNIDDIDSEFKKAYDELEELANTFEEGSKVEYNEREGYTIIMTKKRWETAKAKNNIKLKVSEFKVKPISAVSSMVRLTHPWIEERSHILLKASVALGEVVTKTYREFVATFVEENKDRIYKIVNSIAELDIICTCARNAVDYHYVCPHIDDCDDNDDSECVPGSYLKATALRHPIIEVIHTKTKYVPNDIELGVNGDETGLLLFGMNSSGKSSFMKAIGLNIIMAQAGMFVAADAFIYKPYNNIFTRIAGLDNIYRGWSTFTIEMLELKTILQRANSYSLVLGDELCSGTEALSGLAIVAAGVNILVQKVATFIFATHLHDLGKLKNIKECDKIRIAHMHVEVNKDSGLLIFDRKLRDGIGSEMYGLEVCKGLGLPSDFLKMAHEIRCEIKGIEPEFVATKTSRYNSAVKVGECKICGENVATETHHISPQMLADSHGFIEHFHKNREFNLIPVCEKCHNDIHNGKKHVEGYKETSEGMKLVVKSASASTSAASTSASNQNICYYNKKWYIRKTKRSKWNVATFAEVKMHNKNETEDEMRVKYYKEHL